MVGSDAGGDGELELLSLCEALSGQVSGVEGGGDDNFCVDELPVEGRVLALLVRGGYEGVALVFEPLADAKLVLGCAQEIRDLFLTELAYHICFFFPAILER